VIFTAPCNELREAVVISTAPMPDPPLKYSALLSILAALVSAKTTELTTVDAKKTSPAQTKKIIAFLKARFIGLFIFHSKFHNRKLCREKTPAELTKIC
jgi:hypothetical protein